MRTQILLNLFIITYKCDKLGEETIICGWPGKNKVLTSDPDPGIVFYFTLCDGSGLSYDQELFKT